MMSFLKLEFINVKFAMVVLMPKRGTLFKKLFSLVKFMNVKFPIEGTAK